jgi:hypothetical protein
MLLEGVRAGARMTSAIPSLMMDLGRNLGTTVHNKASMYGVAYQAYALVDVVAVECVSSVSEYFRSYGNLVAAGLKIVVNVALMSYNMTLNTAVGVGRADYYPDGVNVHYKKTCEFEIKYSDNPVSRVRYALMHFVTKYTQEQVPLQQDLVLAIREIVAYKFLMVAVAESMYGAMLWLIYAIDGVLSVLAYGSDVMLTFDDAKLNCISGYMRRADEQFVDTLTSLPNLVTSLIDLSDTTESGYANMACARTTYNNHIYSGSLKQYIFLSSACDI